MKKTMIFLLCLLCFLFVANAAHSDDDSDSSSGESYSDDSSGPDDSAAETESDPGTEMNNEIVGEKDQISPNYDIVTGNPMLETSAQSAAAQNK
jgi:hypothetical protein